MIHYMRSARMKESATSLIRPDAASDSTDGSRSIIGKLRG